MNWIGVWIGSWIGVIHIRGNGFVQCHMQSVQQELYKWGGFTCAICLSQGCIASFLTITNDGFDRQNRKQL